MRKTSVSIYDTKELLESWDYKSNTLDPKITSNKSSQKAWWICKKCGASYERGIKEQKKSMGMIENYYSKDNNMNRLRLNMHKESTIGNIVDLISEQTGICKKNLFVYKFSMNKRFSYIDRFDYNSQYISREMYKTKYCV